MFVYPFESQLGTRLVADRLTSLFPVKYRWPVFPLEGSPQSDYESIIDEECKIRARTPDVSKFRRHSFEFSDEERKSIYADSVSRRTRSRAVNVESFFKATFAAWRNFRRSGREHVYVGYSPILVVDTEALLTDFPDAHVIHVVRNPLAAYADTKTRPVPMPLTDYMLCWCLVQQLALFYAKRYKGKVHLLRAEDLMAAPVETLGPLCRAFGCEPADTLSSASWNGQLLAKLPPWGTIRVPTIESNRATAGKLTERERGEIRDRSCNLLPELGYPDLFE